MIVTTHNSSAFLLRALGSISAQERLPDEVCIVDDRSTDDTLAISEQWAAAQSFPVRLLANKIPHHPLAGPGPAPSKNTALAVLRTDLVALLDHDDEMLPTHIRRTAGALERHDDLELCFGDAIERWADGRTARLLDDAVGLRGIAYEQADDGLRIVRTSFVEAMLPGSRISTAANMWRRSTALSLAGFSERVSGADDWLFFLLLSRKGPVGYFVDPIAHKYTHEANMGHPRHALRTTWNCFDAVSIVLDAAEEWKLHPSEIDVLARRKTELASGVRWASSKQGLRALLAARERLPAHYRPTLRDWLRAALTRATRNAKHAAP